MRRRQRRFLQTVQYLLLVLVTAMFLLPIFYVVTSSLKSPLDALAIPPRWLFKPTTEAYVALFGKTDFPLYFKNSTIIATATVLFSLAAGIPFAYGLARYRFRGAEGTAFFVLATRMSPAIAAAIPYFVLAKRLDLLDRHAGLVIMYTAFSIPFVVWMMRAFISEIPVELEEAALVDGSSRWGILTRIVFPLAAPGVVATSVFLFVGAWNEFMFAFLFTGRVAKTLPVSIAGFITSFGVRWGEMSAAGTLMIAPVLIFAIIIRRQLVRGLTFGSVKG